MALINAGQEVKFKQIPEGTYIYLKGIVLDGGGYDSTIMTVIASSWYG
jgi:hypothetical protein